MNEQVIEGRKFAAAAKIRYATLRYDWTHLTPTITPGGRAMYRVSDLDAWLRASARGYDVPPTTQDIVSKRVTLLTAEEVRKRVPRWCHGRILKLGRRGTLATLKLSPKYILYDAASVEKHAVVPEFYDTTQTCKILGLRHWSTVNNLLRKPGRLHVIEHPYSPKEALAVLRDDLIALLPELLPQWIDPIDWVDDREADPDWPLHVRDAAAYAALSVGDIHSMLNNGKLDFIWLPKRTKRVIPTDALLFHVEEHPITETDVAQFYGVDQQTATYWRHTGRLTCTAHRHSNHDTLCFACLMARARADNPGLKPILHYKNRRRSTPLLLDAKDVGALLGLPPETVLRFAKKGKIRSIVTPGGRRKFSSNAVDQFKRRR